MDLPDIGEKLGPLPIYAWIGVAAGVGFLLMHHTAVATPNPNTTLAPAAAPLLDPSTPQTSFDPIAQITALSQANTAQSQAATAQTTSFFGNIMDLLKGAPNAPNEFTASLPTGGTISFGNDVPTFGNIGGGNTLVSGMQVSGQQAAELANTQGYWANQLANTQGQAADYAAWQQAYASTFHDFTQGYTTNLQNWYNSPGYGQAPPAGGGGVTPLFLGPPIRAAGTPAGNGMVQAPQGNFTAIRAQCQPGDYACAHAVAGSWLGSTPVW